MGATGASLRCRRLLELAQPRATSWRTLSPLPLSMMPGERALLHSRTEKATVVL